jgi:hypothetical protein
MNISVPTGNRRLWQYEDMIAFVGPSSLTVLTRDTVLVSEMGLILGIELGIKLGTELGSRLGIELEKGGLGMKLDFKLEIVIGTDLWIVLGASFGYKLGSRLGTELGKRVLLIESILES